MIEENNIFHLNRFKLFPPHPSYIAGFIDGDGCIFIRKIQDGYQSGFNITQCRTNILQIIRHHFGGTITSSLNRNNKHINMFNKDNYYDKHNVRNQYALLIRNNEYHILLQYLQQSFIIKEKQYQCLYEFNKIANLQEKNEEKEKLFIECSNLKLSYNQQYLNIDRLNIEYIAGIFDAEGCIYICHKNTTTFRISISQKNNPFILNAIKKFLGYGLVDKNEYNYYIYNKTDCLKFINTVKPYLIVKYNQAIAFENYLLTDNIVIKQELYAICNKEKHEIEIFNDLNKNDKGKEGFNETLRLRNIKAQMCKEIHMKHIYKEKSENMKGINNHNYGKKFSEETKQKMSNSIRESKGSVSDDIILQVRLLIEQGYKNIDIQNSLSLNRHTVTRIKNGTIVCRNENKNQKIPLTKEQIAISKRKITVNEILCVIDKLLEKWEPMQILNYLVEERNKNEIKNTLTVNIIKNIKANILKDKLIIYNNEINQEQFIDLTNKINNIKQIYT